MAVGPVLGAQWQAHQRGQCLPISSKIPRFIIPPNKLDHYRSYMKDNALICKFIGIWLTENDLLKWIHIKWQQKGNLDIKLGARGFFTVIFTNLLDKERVFEEGCYRSIWAPFPMTWLIGHHLQDR